MPAAPACRAPSAARKVAAVMADEVALFGRLMRQAYAAGAVFEEAWEAGCAGVASKRCTPPRGGGHPHPGATALERTAAVPRTNSQLTVRQAAAVAGVGVGTAVEARRRLLEAGWVSHRVPPDELIALRATRRNWEAAWCGSPATPAEAAAARLAMTRTPDPIITRAVCRESRVRRRV
jgi:hypothetical protein